MSDGVDLFSGARGWEARAASTLGVDLLGIEWWEPACKTSEAAGLRTLMADIAALNPADYTAEMPESGARLLVGSPPCPTFSNAGNGAGKADMAHVVACTRDLAEGRDTRAEHLARCKDGRSLLVVEPLRWALALKPRAVVLEQVPSVLPYWRQVGEILGALGYWWWAGVLEAERFGVPQTRERAILIARNDGQPAHPPVPTHHRFVPGEPRPADDEGLFGSVRSWVSMAEALGWEDADVLRSNYNDGTTGERGERSADTPGFAVTTKFDRNFRLRPASTDELRADDLASRRPATTVAGDSRVFPPGGHHVPGDQARGAIRVSVEEAACLQSFPSGWPWQDSRTAQFTQVGNAVPPLLGEAILRTVLPPERWKPDPT